MSILGSGGGLASCLAIFDGGQPDLKFSYTSYIFIYIISYFITSVHHIISHHYHFTSFHTIILHYHFILSHIISLWHQFTLFHVFISHTHITSSFHTLISHHHFISYYIISHPHLIIIIISAYILSFYINHYSLICNLIIIFLHQYINSLFSSLSLFWMI